MNQTAPAAPGPVTEPRHKRRQLALAAALVALAGLALRLRYGSLFAIAYADELMQYLEQANRLATGAGLVPWEARAGLRAMLLPQLLAGPVALGHGLAPGTLLPVALARLLFGALTLIALPAAWALGALHSRAAALGALAAVALWWESALFSNLLLSESLGAALLLASAACVLPPAPGARTLAAGGLLCALGVLVRLQYAPFAVVLLIGTLGRDIRAWRPVAAGLLLGAGVGALSDALAGMVPFSWAVVAVRMNLVEGLAARFGTLPAGAYLPMLRDHLAPVGPLLLLLALLAPRRTWPLGAAALANLTVHSLIGHKEYRFVWLTTLSLLVLAGIGMARLVERLLHRNPGDSRPVRTGWPALALVAGWSGLSLLSANVTGGAAVWRDSGAVGNLAAAAARDPRTCGIMVSWADKSHVVPALLPRPVPLLIATEPLRPEFERAALAAPLAAANAAIAARAARITNYRPVMCQGDACLFTRPGGCAPDPRSTYQAVIERAGY